MAPLGPSTTGTAMYCICPDVAVDSAAAPPGTAAAAMPGPAAAIAPPATLYGTALLAPPGVCHTGMAPQAQAWPCMAAYCAPASAPAPAGMTDMGIICIAPAAGPPPPPPA